MLIVECTVFDGSLERGFGVRGAGRVLDEPSSPPTVVLPRVDAPEVLLLATTHTHKRTTQSKGVRGSGRGNRGKTSHLTHEMALSRTETTTTDKAHLLSWPQQPCLLVMMFTTLSRSFDAIT